MNKLLTKIATSFVGIAMAIGVGVAVGNKETAMVDAATSTGDASVNLGSGSGRWNCGSSWSSSGSSPQTDTKTDTLGNTWTLSYAYSSYSKTANASYIQFGSSSKPAKSITLSTTMSGSFKVTNLYSKWGGFSGTAGTVTMKVGSTTVQTGSLSGTSDVEVKQSTGSHSSGVTSNTITIELTGIAKGIKLYSFSYTLSNTAYTVTVNRNNSTYGTISQSSVTNVAANTSISATGNTLTVGTTNVTATPAAQTDDYTYAFSSWTGIPADGKVNDNVTITANFTRTNRYSVGGTITNGSLSSNARIEDGDFLEINIIPDSGYTYPSSISVTMGGNDISDEVEYEKGYLYYGPVTGNIVITATCPALGNTYSITTNVTNGTYSGDTTITDNGGVASVTIAPTGDYKLPASVSVSGADHSYNASNGVISLSNATGNVTISATMDPLTEYSITVNKTNGSYTGASTIKESRTASLTFTPDSGWGQPADVSVSGADKSWNRTSGVLTLSNPTGNVTVTYDAAENELTSITLSANSRVYTLGDSFVKPTVTAHYTVAADANVTESSNLVITGYDPYTPGTQPVTFTYTEGGIQKTASYTATVNAKSVQTITTWEATTLSQLTADDVFVIVGNNGSNYAMTNNNGTSSAPGVAAVTVSNNKLSADPAANLQWNISGNASDGYTFYPNGSTTTWLYCTSSNNGVRVGANTDKTFTISDEGYLLHAGTSRYVGIYNSQDWRCYTSINSNIQDQTFSYFKKVVTKVGTASLIRIVCDPAIDPATGYKGGDKFVGDKVYTTDFVVKKQYDTGASLEAVTGFTINGGEEVELTSTSNTITVSYTEGGIPKSTEVVVAATERAAELESVQLVEKGEVKKSGYIDFASAAWNLDNIYVHYYWSDDDFDTEVTLASLVATDDATISPIKPTVGATSFTVSYEYLEVQITNNTITLTEAVRSDYVTSMSWGNTTESHFKHFSGEQLTEAIVNTWHVKATYAGAGEGSRLYWGDYDLYIGSKQITSLPYTWLSEDDGQALSIHYGKDVDGNEFVKTNATAVGNICATINAIDHDETVSGLIDKSTGWTTEQSSALSDQDFGTRDLDANISMTGVKSSGSTNVRIYSGTLRTYANNEMYFTPSNGAIIKTINLANISATECSDGEATHSGNVWTIKNGTEAITFTGLNKVTVNADIVVEYQINGSETTTVHYANQMEHFDAQKKVVEFAKFMNTTMNGTNVCSGTFANLEDAWGDVKDKYDELFGASTTLNATELAWAKNMLKYANAAWGSDAENACVEKAMKTYEFCIAKYGVDPFMFESDGTTPLRSIVVGPSINTLFSKNSSTVSVIVIVSLISIAAVGGYFFLRKRKED